MIEFIQHDFRRLLSTHGLFQCFSHRLAYRCERKPDKHEQKKGQKVLRREQPTVGGRKYCIAQGGAVTKPILADDLTSGSVNVARFSAARR